MDIFQLWAQAPCSSAGYLYLPTVLRWPAAALGAWRDGLEEECFASSRATPPPQPEYNTQLTSQELKVEPMPRGPHLLLQSPAGIFYSRQSTGHGVPLSQGQQGTTR